MARPSTLPTWDTNLTNTTATPAGQTTDGWAVNAVPPSGVENYWKNLVYQWINWLNGNVLDQNWTFQGNVAVGGTTTFTGNTTCNGLLLANGGATLQTTTVQGNCTVTGNLSVQGSLTIASTETVYSEPEKWFDNFATNGARVTTHTLALWGITFANSTVVIRIPVPGLRAGDVISGYGISLNKTTGTGIQHTFQFSSYSTAGEVLYGVANTTSGGAGLQAVADTFTPITVTGQVFYLKISPNTVGIGAAGDQIFQAQFTVKRTVG